MKKEISEQVLWGVGAVMLVGVIGFLFYIFRASDPAARGPVPYKKFDYGAHVQQQTRDLNRQPGAAVNASPAGR